MESEFSQLYEKHNCFYAQKININLFVQPSPIVKRGRKLVKTNVVAAKLGKKIIEPFCYSENMTNALFVEWFRKKFLKSVSKGTTAILDNASAIYHYFGVSNS